MYIYFYTYLIIFKIIIFILFLINNDMTLTKTYKTWSISETKTKQIYNPTYFQKKN